MDVGSWPFLNLLLLAYLAPAVLTALYARAAINRDDQMELALMGTVTLLLTFIYVSLSVRHFFVGPYLDAAPVSDPEQYTYSVVWILYGIALLTLGIWRNIRALRYASLAVLMLATAKVFLWDMSGLTGLLRAVSFLGLGGTLLAIGFVYQRFVFPAAPIPDAAEESLP